MRWCSSCSQRRQLRRRSTTTADHTLDVDAITRLIADIETAFNTNDPDLAVRHFTADASGVGVTGALLSGWPALFEAHRQAYAGPLRDQRARYDVAGVVFLRPDDRVIEGGGAMIALYVLVKQDGRWWIAPPPEHPGPVGGIRRSTHSRRTSRRQAARTASSWLTIGGVHHFADVLRECQL
ncbi:MAG: SgcJ/EcaC family oxidoreductase [Acidimicrobiales bacterium]